MNPRLRRSTISSAVSVRLELRAAPVLGVLVTGALLAVPVGLWLGNRTGALPGAVLVAASSLLAARPILSLFQPPAGGPRALLVSGSGDLWLESAGHPRRPVEVAGTSLVRGPWLVLRLASGTTRFRVLIETRQSQAAERAALVRALRRRAAAPDRPRHALRSLLEKGEPGP